MTTTIDTLPPEVLQTAALRLLSVPVPYMIHNICATRKILPRQGGTTLRMRRYNPLKPSLVPLGNSGSQLPAPQQLSAVNIDAKINYYGTFIQLSEVVTLTNQGPVLAEASTRLSVSLRESEDILTRNMLLSTASYINCIGGVNGDLPTEISRQDIDDVTKTLATNNAFNFSRTLPGSDRFATAPVRDAFFGLGSTSLIGQLENVEGFTQVANYPRPGALEEEWGAIGSIRFLLSSLGSMSPGASRGGVDVYNTFVSGQEAYTTVEQSGYSAQFLYRPPIFSSALALTADVGYKFSYAARITNDLWIYNLRSTLR